VSKTPVIKTYYTHNHDQLADVFAEVLTSMHFHLLPSKLRSINPLDLARGRVLKESYINPHFVSYIIVVASTRLPILPSSVFLLLLSCK